MINIRVMGYSDVDFASCVNTKKSMSGYIFAFTGGAISWKAPSKVLLHRRQCNLSLCHVMRLPSR